MSSHERLIPGKVETVRAQYQVLYDPISRRAAVRLTCDDTAYKDAWATDNATDETYLEVAAGLALIWECNTILIAQLSCSSAAGLHNKIALLTAEGGEYVGLMGVMSVRWSTYDKTVGQNVYCAAVFISRSGVLN